MKFKSCELWIDDHALLIYDWHEEDHYSGQFECIVIDDLHVVMYIENIDKDITKAFSEKELEAFKERIIDNIRFSGVA